MAGFQPSFRQPCQKPPCWRTQLPCKKPPCWRAISCSVKSLPPCRLSAALSKASLLVGYQLLCQKPPCWQAISCSAKASLLAGYQLPCQKPPCSSLQVALSASLLTATIADAPSSTDVSWRWVPQPTPCGRLTKQLNPSDYRSASQSPNA